VKRQSAEGKPLCRTEKLAHRAGCRGSFSLAQRRDEQQRMMRRCCGQQCEQRRGGFVDAVQVIDQNGKRLRVRDIQKPCLQGGLRAQSPHSGGPREFDRR
jgi:hypothetical protein